MATYWKSQPKKHCDYCKCWITDNKASVQFHERGKNHQQNVKKKLDELRKKGVKDAKKKEEDDNTMKAIERAAMKALKNDLKNDPSLASQYGVKIPAKTAIPADNKQNKSKPTAHITSTSHMAQHSTPTESSAEQLPVDEWDEATSPEGYTYYWNATTGETTWEMPEGYKPRVGTQEEQSQEHITEITTESNTPPTDVSSEKPPDLTPVESHNKTPVTPREPPTCIADIPLPGDTIEIPLPPEPVKVKPKVSRPPRPSALGSWETVTYEEEELEDLQLPTTDNIETTAEVPNIAIEEPKLKFKEKRITSLSSTGSTSESVVFKKRKVNSYRQSRRQNDDE